MNLKCDAVFEGGGVRGIGHIGAANAIEKAGYKFENLAGSSCGAIVAALIAVGYNTNEIKEILKDIDYTKFPKETKIDKFGIPGKILNLSLRYGIYSTSYFEEWFKDLILQKNKTKFGDIKIKNPEQEKYKYKLQVTASDITAQRLLTFPGDLNLFGLDLDDFSIVTAVKMSMSIPLFFMPYSLNDKTGLEHYIVDGGMLSNYPIWILDDGTSNPSIPTFGFKFCDECKEDSAWYIEENINLISYSQMIINTMTNASDNQRVSETKGDYQRSIMIPITIKENEIEKNIRATDFSINKEQSNQLFSNGYNAAQKFLKGWNFEEWKRKYRN